MEYVITVKEMWRPTKASSFAKILRYITNAPFYASNQTLSHTYVSSVKDSIKNWYPLACDLSSIHIPDNPPGACCFYSVKWVTVKSGEETSESSSLNWFCVVFLRISQSNLVVVILLNPQKKTYLPFTKFSFLDSDVHLTISFPRTTISSPKVCILLTYV